MTVINMDLEGRENMFGKYFCRKALKKNHYEETLLKLATAPAALNISMLSEDARGVLERYLQALYARQTDLLPAEGMEEACYKRTVQLIQGQEAPVSAAMPRIQSFSVEAYDRSVMYKVGSITYRAVYSIIEPERQDQLWEITAVFNYDERLGWLLGAVCHV